MPESKKKNSFRENSAKICFEDERIRKTTRARGSTKLTCYAKALTKDVQSIQRLGECTCTSYLPIKVLVVIAILVYKFIHKYKPLTAGLK